MLKEFQVIHRRKPRSFGAKNPLFWETCLRSISFTTDPEHVTLHETDELYVSHNAYQFLLEIICGLHSPIVGETEVFGQFKNFAKEWQRLEPQRATLIQRLFADAKEIRSRFLCGIGTQSYGGWVKRNLRSNRVHILGGGNLAQEIAPYLLKNSESLTLHVRTPSKADGRGARVVALSDRAFNGGALVVAAPVAAADIQIWFGPQTPSEIFDLRAESAADPIQLSGVRVHALADVFQEIEQTKARLLPIVEQVKSEIQSRGERLAVQSLLRPQGWDDICA